MNNFIQNCRKLIGSEFVLTGESDVLPYVTDWRQREKGKAIAVLRPGSTNEVSMLVRLCSELNVSIVPQGGNTGLVLGSIPERKGKSVVISLTRINKIRAVDIENNTITADAGCYLEQVQNAAFDASRLFPLSLASEGSCTIGGNLSTNAGGTAVLRYGNARDLCLGLEVVTPAGDIWNGMRGLRKDNTGYDLKNLFIGAEGTLGIITGAVLKLCPQPKAQRTAFVAVHDPERALQFLMLAQTEFGPLLTGFELMSEFCISLVKKHNPQLDLPFKEPYPNYVLIELSDHESEAHLNQLMEKVLCKGMNAGIILDAALSTSLQHSKSFWKLRELISTAQASEGKNIKHDISVPVSNIPKFIEVTNKLLSLQFPKCRIVCFGHMGDGNLHYNVS
ncbi:MAG: FAD-binding oxidoreductase, partial [Burkholderiales bacterium]|nr:FAD-binding oxidoreductase [Burkholderiales bacterium]